MLSFSHKGHNKGRGFWLRWKLLKLRLDEKGGGIYCNGKIRRGVWEFHFMQHRAESRQKAPDGQLGDLADFLALPDVNLGKYHNSGLCQRKEKLRPEKLHVYQVIPPAPCSMAVTGASSRHTSNPRAPHCPQQVFWQGLISELFVVTNPGNGVSVFCKTTAKRSDNNIHSRQGGSLCTDVEGWLNFILRGKQRWGMMCVLWHFTA